MTKSLLVTVGMSALWNRQSTARTFLSNVTQQLELREVPQVYVVPDYEDVYAYDATDALIIDTVYGTYLTSWLYGGVTEISQGSESPPFSKDTFSFTPIDFRTSQGALEKAAPSLRDTDGLVYNITFSTTAIQARLECSRLEYISNESLWLNEVVIEPSSNTSISNMTERQNPTNVYQLRPMIYFPEAPTASGTAIVANSQSPVQVVCCSNVTDGLPGDAALGYWTFKSFHAMKMVAKWIVGRPYDDHPTDSRWYWSAKPDMQAIECSPVIERYPATVTVDAATGAVRNYTIDGRPENVTAAWSDNYLVRQATEYIPGEQLSDETVTTSYGHIFWDALLSASVFTPYTSEESSFVLPQSEDDHRFSFRVRGLNVDFMSYAMYAMVDNEKAALLDEAILTEKANHVFGVFFKHFVSNNVSFNSGGTAYQPIGERLPQHLSDAVNATTAGYTNPISDSNKGPQTIEVEIHVPIEVLVMSSVAVFLCIGLLVFLLFTIITVYIHRSRFKGLPRDVDTLASVLAFVYASPNLFDWVGKRVERDDWDDEGIAKGWLARLGVLRDEQGVERWGIEIERAGTNQMQEYDENENAGRASLGIKGGKQMAEAPSEEHEDRR